MTKADTVLFCHDLQLLVLRCHVLGLSALLHTFSSTASAPITTCSSSDETMFRPGEEGGGERSRRVEHSVPAGDKGEACQRPIAQS